MVYVYSVLTHILQTKNIVFLFFLLRSNNVTNKAQSLSIVFYHNCFDSQMLRAFVTIPCDVKFRSIYGNSSFFSVGFKCIYRITWETMVSSVIMNTHSNLRLIEFSKNRHKHTQTLPNLVWNVENLKSKQITLETIDSYSCAYRRFGAIQLSQYLI